MALMVTKSPCTTISETELPTVMIGIVATYPPSPVHTTDFKFTEANLTDSTYFDVDAFWIVIGPAFNKETAEDFYTITLKTMERANEEGVRPLKIIYYKK